MVDAENKSAGGESEKWDPKWIDRIIQHYESQSDLDAVAEDEAAANGQPYINIGTEKSCCFVAMSIRFCDVLQKYPLLHYAVEEALVSAAQGYYSAGIIAFDQILNVLHQPTSPARHRVAHEILSHRPSKSEFDELLERVKYEARKLYVKERSKAVNPREHFITVLQRWKKVMELHHCEGL